HSHTLTLVDALPISTFTTGPVTAACIVTATFSQNQFDVTATAGNGGSVTPTSQSIGYGSTTTLSVIPDTGYTIDQVTGCNGTLRDRKSTRLNSSNVK